MERSEIRLKKNFCNIKGVKSLRKKSFFFVLFFANFALLAGFCWYWCCYPHWSKDFLSLVCRIFFLTLFVNMLFTSIRRTQSRPTIMYTLNATPNILFPYFLPFAWHSLLQEEVTDLFVHKQAQKVAASCGLDCHSQTKHCESRANWQHSQDNLSDLGRQLQEPLLTTFLQFLLADIFNSQIVSSYVPEQINWYLVRKTIRARWLHQRLELTLPTTWCRCLLIQISFAVLKLDTT